ncbi:hypothetical protein [Prauserella endophytica]|uniref:YkuD domain-containing protein n=1 Tax=Prauserella endophytica TaxID=1592324 RepID=A0ABY2RZ40_9PSEU|nr:hypothetical protein [Prauserella endophytica]TKG66269.1 hypothetical protein FCN18_25905 [Prauserella endophytica]
MYWAFDNIKSKDAGAYPPEPLELSYGHRPAGSDRLRGTELQRAYTVSGREVRPADCGPVRVLSRFGHVVRAPGRITIQREEPGLKWRDFQPDSSAYGRVRVGGDPWHGTESGFVASWIAGSEYVKISTGILIYFPKGHMLYQGPIPNRQLVDDPTIASDQLDVMAGMEYFVPGRSRELDGHTYGIAALNIIARAPRGGAVVEVHKGQVIGWFHLVAPPATQTIEQLPRDHGGRS